MNVVRALLPVCALVLIVLVLVPLGALLQASFTTSPPGVLTAEYTLKNWIQVYTYPFYHKIVSNTLFIGAAATILSVLMGVVLAWIFARTNTPQAELLEVISLAPIFLSPFVGALAWTFLLGPRAGLINYHISSLLGLKGPVFDVYSFPGMIFVLSLYYCPYVFLICSSAFKSMDPSLEEASSITGASQMHTALRVTLPLNVPAIAGASILVFILAIEDFGVAATIGMPAGIYVLSTQIYALLSSVPPAYGTAMVAAVILLALTTVGVYLQRRFMGYGIQYTTITGKGYRPRIIDLGRWRYVTLTLCLLYILAAVVLPIFALALTSFLRYYSPTFTLESFSLWNFEFLATYPKALKGIQNTLFLAALGATIGVLFSFIISYIVYRTSLPKRSILDQLSALPLAIPGMALASALLWIWVGVPGGIYGSIWILMLAYITRFIPYSTRATSSTIIQIHHELEESSRMCGASQLRAMVSIVLPLAKYGILSGWTLLFILFTREIAASILLYTPENVVLPVVIFGLWENGVLGPMAAMSLIQIIIILIPLFIAQRIGGRLRLF